MAHVQVFLHPACCDACAGYAFIFEAFGFQSLVCSGRRLRTFRPRSLRGAARPCVIDIRLWPEQLPSIRGKAALCCRGNCAGNLSHQRSGPQPCWTIYRSVQNPLPTFRQRVFFIRFPSIWDLHSFQWPTKISRPKPSATNGYFARVEDLNTFTSMDF